MDKRKRGWELVEALDRNSFYTEPAIKRGIEENRMGGFVIKVLDENHNPVEGARVEVNQVSHDFNFGCSTFLLDEFDSQEKNDAYRKYFVNVFNHGTVALYWDKLEPEPGKPRFSKDSPKIWRRPPVDLITEFARENNIKLKGHCLMYNAFNPDWMPKDSRGLRIAVEKRAREIGERYAEDFVDLDVINEMIGIYRNAYDNKSDYYGAPWHRNLHIVDDADHEKWCFDVAKKYFPFSKLIWNEGMITCFGNGPRGYCGNRSWFYTTLKRFLNEGVQIGGIGMQFHLLLMEEQFDLVNSPWDDNECVNLLRIMEVLDRYGDFNLPIQLCETTIPSWSNEEEHEEIQAEMLKRYYRTWFSRKNVDAITWWNLVDGTAYGEENKYFGGLLRNDMTPKKAYKELERLIKKEWHTEYAGLSDKDGRLNFNGFYGDYEVCVTYNGKQVKCRLDLSKEQTGYAHSSGMLREKIITV